MPEISGSPQGAAWRVPDVAVGQALPWLEGEVGRCRLLDPLVSTYRLRFALAGSSQSPSVQSARQPSVVRRTQAAVRGLAPKGSGSSTS